MQLIKGLSNFAQTPFSSGAIHPRMKRSHREKKSLTL